MVPSRRDVAAVRTFPRGIFLGQFGTSTEVDHEMAGNQISDILAQPHSPTGVARR